MLLEKAHYIKYKSQVIIVNFDEKKKRVQGENGKEGDGRAKECTYQVSPE